MISIRIIVLSCVCTLVMVFVCCSGGGRKCEPEVSTQCVEGVTYWVNSCGIVGQVRETCQNGCAADGLDCSCADGAVRCSNNLAEQCLQGTWQVSADCALQGGTCSDGQCVVPCVDGDRQCAGDWTQTCVGGAWQWSLNCTDSGQTCAAGQCSDPCTDGDSQCAGDWTQTCVAGSWQNGTNCADSGVSCNAGQCATPCTDGAIQCDLDWTQSCVAGSWQSNVNCADGGQSCRDGLCVDGCVESEQRCNGTWVQACVLGNWQDTFDCASSTQDCTSGRCEGAGVLIFIGNTALTTTYWGLAQTLQEAGAPVVDTSYDWDGTDLLSRYRVIFVMPAVDYFEVAKDDLAAFVSSGGALVLVVEHSDGWGSTYEGNLLAEYLGLNGRFDGWEVMSGCNEAPKLTDHALTTDAESISVARSNTVSGATSLYGIDDFSVVSVEGRVLLAGDSNIFDDADYMGACGQSQATYTFYANIYHYLKTL